MATSKTFPCVRCNKTVYAADSPVILPGWQGHGACFKCKDCGLKLTLTTQFTEEGEVFCKVHKPVKVTSVGPGDVVINTQTSVPDSRFGTREFGKGDAKNAYGVDGVAMQTALTTPDFRKETVEIAKTDVRHNYGDGAVAVVTAINSEKPVTNVNNVNNLEVRHSGVKKFTST